MGIQICIVLLLGLITFSLGRMITSGKPLATAHKAYKGLHSSDPGYKLLKAEYGSRLAVHKYRANFTLVCVAMLILLVEGLVLSRGRSDHDIYFFVHLLFAISFTVSLLALRFAFTGVNHPNHGIFAYVTILIFFPPTAIIGLWQTLK